MFEEIKKILTENSTTIYGFKSGNTYYSVVVDENLNYWFKVNGGYHFGNIGLIRIVDHLKNNGLELKDNITSEKFFGGN